MADLQQLKDLERRLQEATGPDRELDAAIWQEFIGPVDRFAEPWLFYHGHLPVHEFHENALTASVNAALALVEEVLPGWDWSISRLFEGRYSAGANTWDDRKHAEAEQKTPALALCLALVRARIEEPDND